MLKLNDYISNNSIRDNIFKSHKYITNINDVDEVTNDIVCGRSTSMIFEKNSLKNHFFEQLSKYVDVNIVNCNTHIGRFCEDYMKESTLTVFDNIKLCNDPNILELIYNSKGIFIG